MKDVLDELAAATRTAGSIATTAGEAKQVRLQRVYAAEIGEVWEALTTAERIARWFLPISGDLRLGGRYQLTGNAGGAILACDPPRHVRVSWEMGPQTPQSFSEVAVTLSAVDEGTAFELVHTAIVPPGMWDQFGPGAVGVGWDGGLLGLARHLAGHLDRTSEERLAWLASEQGRAFLTASSEAWGDAYRASGAGVEQAAAATAATTAFYAPPTSP